MVILVRIKFDLVFVSCGHLWHSYRRELHSITVKNHAVNVLKFDFAE